MERQNLSTSQHLWWTERDSLLIAYYNANSDKFNTIDKAGEKIHILYVQRPDKFLIPGENPERDGFTTHESNASTGTYLGIELGEGPSVTDANFLSQECEIPEQFHEALIARVIANGYERKAETIPLAQHFHMKYEQGVKLCKVYASKGRDAVYGQLRPMPF